MTSEKKIRLVLLSAFYEPYMSGAEQMTKNIAERMGEFYEITIVTGRYDQANVQTEQRQGFKIIRVGIGHKQLDKLLYVWLAPLVSRRLKPDIIHAIMESYAGGALVLCKYICAQSKRLLTLQSGDLDDSKKSKRSIQRFVWRIIHRSPDMVTAISSALAERARNLGVAEDKIRIVPNGLDFSQVPVSGSRIKDRVICVARLSWEKSHSLILDAWVGVRKLFPDASLVFVGEGPERVMIEKKIGELDIGGSVSLAGNLAHSEVLKELSRSEVFVCPSLAEGLGNVFIEAQACGVPPVGTRVGGIPDVIRDGINGILIEPKSSSAIEAALIDLLKDPAKRERLRAAGLISSRRFEWQGIINEIDAIYKNLLGLKWN